MSALSHKSVVAFAVSMVVAAGGLTVATGPAFAAEKDERAQEVRVLFVFDGRQAFMTPVNGSHVCECFPMRGSDVVHRPART